MLDLWSPVGARAAVFAWADAWGEAVALRTYSSRLLGADRALVLHGGGNTSVKGTWTDLLGQPIRALFVKGSGWDLDTLEPPGLVAVDLERLRALRALGEVSDPAMVNALRTARFDASAPNPSVETLLHAFLPHTYVDHSHAEAVLALTNSPDGAARAGALLGMPVVPYVMPGFALAKAAAEVADAHPDAPGLILDRHGLFTFGATAEESYRRHIAAVTAAETWLAERRALCPSPRAAATSIQAATARAAELAPCIRGALGRGWVLDHRVSEPILTFVDAPDVGDLAASGPLTPDHVIRTKPRPMVLMGDPRDAVAAFRSDYAAYYVRHARADTVMLDSTPRVLLVPGAGLFGVGADPVAAGKAADLYERTIGVKLGAEPAVGPYIGLPESDLFDMEYWVLEQAKLGRGGPKAPLAGRVALVTGAAGAVGYGVARQLHAAGAQLVLTDLDEARLAAVAAGFPHGVAQVACDLTDPDAVGPAFRRCALFFGGIDIVVLNAGIAAVGALDAISEETFARLTAVNLTGTWRALRESTRLLTEQGTGGSVVLVSTKNVLAPGAQFGAYSATKAGAHQLARVAALELAEHGIRVNLVTPDAVFDEDGVASGLWAEVGPERARSKGLEPDALPEHYRQRNLLQTRVTGSDVGRAVVFFASEATPTTGAVLPVDGGLPGAFPR
ncbi:MAG: rhamnulose-1-phosphate aldolase/alcohol dehydrogenase [Myxococcota bacterium]|jgi:rhamnulose-1-phosphate aldolase/alcohol dehydrogenase